MLTSKEKKKKKGPHIKFTAFSAQFLSVLGVHQNIQVFISAPSAPRGLVASIYLSPIGPSASLLVVEEGQDALLECDYSPTTPDAFLQLVWRYNNGPVIIAITCSMARPDECSKIKTTGRYSLAVNFIGSGNLTINNVGLNDETTYECDVTLQGSTAKNHEIEMVVLGKKIHLNLYIVFIVKVHY